MTEDEIAYVHDADTEAKKNRLFAKMRSGEIRILLGSTFKLGLGVNVQKKLIALHHIDVPWRPADMTQREGRILRQGNENEKVEIHRYITEGSFDAYSWQLLETKQRFITELLSGYMTERSGSDIEDTVLDYAEVKALAIGNPLIKERVETANELSRYLTLQRKATDSRIKLEQEKLKMPGLIQNADDRIVLCKQDIIDYWEWKEANPPVTDNKKKKEEAEQRRMIREKISSAVRKNLLSTKESTIMNYRGFDIVLPVNMKPETPFIWLKGKGKYRVELGDTEVGNLIRIDNYLDNLDKHLQELEEDRNRLVDKEADIEENLLREESYTDQIEFYRKKLEEIDTKLGVTKK